MITALELQSDFENAIRSQDKVAGKVFQTSEMNQFLNQAQTAWLKEKIPLFDADERNRKILSGLVRTFSIGGISAQQSDGLYWRLYSLPEDVYAVVMESIKVSNNTVKVKPITYDEYLQNIDNTYRRPYDKLAWRLDTQNGHSIISIFAMIDTYNITYLTKPIEINIESNSEFSFEEEAKKEIVEAAVALALQALSVEQSSTKE